MCFIFIKRVTTEITRPAVLNIYTICMARQRVQAYFYSYSNQRTGPTIKMPTREVQYADKSVHYAEDSGAFGYNCTIHKIEYDALGKVERMTPTTKQILIREQVHVCNRCLLFSYLRAHSFRRSVIEKQTCTLLLPSLWANN